MLHDSSMAFFHASDAEATPFFNVLVRKEAMLQMLPCNTVLIKNSTSDNLVC